MQKRISIIFWEGYLEVSPTLIALIQYFSEKKQLVDVYIRDDHEFELPVIKTLQNEFVRFYRIEAKRKTKSLHLITRFFDYSYIYLGKLSAASADKLKKHFLQLKDVFYISYFTNEVKQIAKTEKYDVTFCVDGIGLYIHKKSKMRSSKIINVSLEIGVEKPEKIFWLKRILKKNEIKYLNDKISYTLIQDIFRWDLYKRVNRIAKDNFKILLNSLRKNNDPRIHERSYFFNEKFNLPLDTTIVVSAGMISEFVCSTKIAEAVGTYHFKSPVKIIFHNRLQEKNDEYYKQLLNAGKENLLLSLDPVPFSEVYKLSTSAHIGLVIYDTENVNENYATVGAASGKLYQYMQYGLPIIASNNKGLSNIIVDNQIGLVVKNMQEIPAAIEKIIDNYNFYSTNSKKAFEEKYNLDIFLDKIYEDL